MRWPWNHEQPALERRDNQPFTDAVITGILRSLEVSQDGDASAIGALETAAGLWAHAFASAKVSPMNAATEAVTPSILALIGRELVRRGEAVFAIKMVDGELVLVPVGTWDVRGPWQESMWTYRCDIFGASEHTTELLPSTGVVHPRYAVDPVRPWIGVAPLSWARLTGALAANLETRLGEEVSAPVGSLMPVPQDGGDGEEDEDPLHDLKADLKRLKGNVALVETTAAGWGEGRGSAPQADWMPRRMGGNPPPASVDLMDKSALMVLSACGVPVSLATDADGTSQRESWRRFVMGTLEPASKMVTEELSRKLETPVSFDFSGLWAHDLAGRASSFKAMATAGMEMEKAIQLSGLMSD